MFPGISGKQRLHSPSLALVKDIDPATTLAASPSSIQRGARSQWAGRYRGTSRSPGVWARSFTARPTRPCLPARLPTDPPGSGIARPLSHEPFVFGPIERGEPGSYSPRSFDLRMVGEWASVPVALAVRSCCSVDTRAYPTRGSFIL